MGYNHIRRRLGKKDLNGKLTDIIREIESTVCRSLGGDAHLDENGKVTDSPLVPLWLHESADKLHAMILVRSVGLAFPCVVEWTGATLQIEFDLDFALASL